jgi:hypothetical protein
MDLEQEETLYEFLENIIEPFSLDDITSYVQTNGQKRSKKLAMEIGVYLESRKIAFRHDNWRWISRRGCFEPAVFVISPSRLELLNGILIPGHRCVPFANPLALPHHFKFFWKGKPIPVTTTEAPPEDLYPYYCVYGEEFAPQYIARDNPENEEAFSSDLYEDPPEVSIHTLDMRSIYRESSFIPGDRFVVSTTDWKDCCFNLEKVRKDEWSAEELNKWAQSADNGFESSFALLGPGANTEEQIAFAYWYGGKRMREIPAYSLEEFLFEKTECIEAVPYGIETRFWFTGREIPDSNKLQNINVPPDRTLIEEILYIKNIPVSEFVVLSYIRDAFFRNEKDIDKVINRIVPPIVHIDEEAWDVIADYTSDRMEEMSKSYSLFLDKGAGPVRQRAAELHTVIIELSTRLQKSDIETAWLPRHTFIVLSQIQGHAAALLEDLAFDDSPPESEIIAMDNSLDSMVDTYGDIKELINSAMDNFRRSNLTVIRGGNTEGQLWRMIQVSITPLDVWRRAIVSHDCTLDELHLLIKTGFNWEGNLRFRFYVEVPVTFTEAKEKRSSSDSGKRYLDNSLKLGDIDFHGKKEIFYEYGAKWTINIIIMSSYQSVKDEVTRFVAGEGAAPPEVVGGPRHFSKLIDIIENGSSAEKQSAMRELGAEFSQSGFELDKVNRNLRTALSKEEKIKPSNSVF